MSEHIPHHDGTAVDIGGGAGHNALWLARRGLEVTLADISDVALDQARTTARDQGLELECMQRDLEDEGLPDGRLWDVALMHLYYPRELLRELPTHIEPGGLLLFSQPTVLNLERHDRPSRRFLVEPGELKSLADTMTNMEVLELSEEWRTSDRHDAWLVARRLQPGHAAVR
jgi:tellurite methyltransferase